MSNQLEVRCPACGGRATFDEAFEFVSSARTDKFEPLVGHRWGSWIVRERYPSLIRWTAPPGPSQFLQSGGDTGETGGYRLRHTGVVRCRACHWTGLHQLDWRRDAYFQWKIRRDLLWAWHAEHARVLLHYIESTLRNPARYGMYGKPLRELPAAAIAAANRSTVARKIRESLVAAGEPPEWDGVPRREPPP